ncbi:MAG: aminopeptidase [Candidatus Marinamargulisbacteria bacterium]
MNASLISQYADLLTTYCCQVRSGDRVLIRSTYLAEDLILACQQKILTLGATCEFDISLPHTGRQKYTFSSDEALALPPILYSHAVVSFNVVIAIHAPFDLFELKGVDSDRLAVAQSALKPAKTAFMQRGKSGDLRWVICNYPTQSLAEAAGMSLDEYSAFIADACWLGGADPTAAWMALSERQQRYVDRLNQGQRISFQSPTIDVSFSIEGRSWVNSDGKRNMPSGEVFTSPVENSGSGTIVFDHPSLLFGEVIRDLTLELVDGVVVHWSCGHGQALLDRLFTIDGANKVGEIAIGTNDAIKVPTLNTLFDEKIGGTIHMAVGASYPETGGQNESSVHHDFVTSFRSASTITVDDDIIYKNGQFIV